MSRALTVLAALAVLATSGCAASRAQAQARPSWTPPAQDQTYRTAEEASAAFETASKLAGPNKFRYVGNGHWQILGKDLEVLREVVIGGRADIDWNQ